MGVSRRCACRTSSPNGNGATDHGSLFHFAAVLVVAPRRCLPAGFDFFLAGGYTCSRRRSPSASNQLVRHAHAEDKRESSLEVAWCVRACSCDTALSPIGDRYDFHLSRPDVRPILRDGGEPFSATRRRARWRSGQEPVPVSRYLRCQFQVLGALFEAAAREIGGGDREVIFTPASAAAPAPSEGPQAGNLPPPTRRTGRNR